jgi:hypothetical protein
MVPVDSAWGPGEERYLQSALVGHLSILPRATRFERRRIKPHWRALVNPPPVP